MIEDALFLALGFCGATLIALACLPVLWARALRLTRARLALLVPSSQAEIDAASDALRAQAAVVQRRLEQRIETGQHAAALARTELGQRTVSLVAAEQAGEALRAEKGSLIGELGALARAMRDGEGQRAALEKALHDADGRIETAATEAAAAALQREQLALIADERRGAIAALETRAAGLLAKLEDGQEHIAGLEVEAAGRARAHAMLAAELEVLQTASAEIRVELAAAQQALVDAQEHAAERDRRLRQRSDALAAAEVRMTEQDAQIKQGQAELAALKQRFAALEAELQVRGREGSMAEPPDMARSDALLRSAIVAVSDDALRLLKPPVEDQSSVAEAGAGILVRERQP